MKKLRIILFSILAIGLAGACVSIPLALSYGEKEVSVPAPEGFFPSFHYNVSMKWKRKREEKKEVIVSYRLFSFSDEEVMKAYGSKKVEFTLSRVCHDENGAKNSLVLEKRSLLFSELVDLKGDGTFTDSVSASEFDGMPKGSLSYVVSVQLEEGETYPSIGDDLPDFLCEGKSHSCLYDIKSSGIYIKKPDIPKNVSY